MSYCNRSGFSIFRIFEKFLRQNPFQSILNWYTAGNHFYMYIYVCIYVCVLPDDNSSSFWNISTKFGSKINLPKVGFKFVSQPNRTNVSGPNQNFEFLKILEIDSLSNRNAQGVISYVFWVEKSIKTSFIRIGSILTKLWIKTGRNWPKRNFGSMDVWPIISYGNQHEKSIDTSLIQIGSILTELWGQNGQ